jgi:hypothetical protein
MKALIATNEPREGGYRVAQVADSELFHADLPLFWVDCDESVVADEFWFDPADSQIKPVPAYNPTDEDIADRVRGERNMRLLTSDWTQLPDVPVETKEQWAIYRQALRDVTNQPGFPHDVVWPVAPTSGE